MPTSKRPDREVPTVVHFPKVVNVRVKGVYKQYLLEIAEHNHKTQSDIIREIIEKSLYFRHLNLMKKLKGKEKKSEG